MRVVRRIQKAVHESFNDGYIYYGFDKVKRDKNRKRVGEEFESHGKLAFRIMSARDQDYHIAGLNNASLDLKVKTTYPPNFRLLTVSKLKCVIDNLKYDVIKVDGDNDKRYLYFYLQKVGVLDE